MSASRIFPVAFALMLSVAAVAQEAPAPAPAPAPAAAPVMPRDCAKPMARHDHGAEKGMPMSMSAACPMAATTSAKTKARPLHDHSRAHKLM